MNPGPGVHGFQRALAAVSNRSVALGALIGLPVPSVAVVGFWLLAARRHEPADFAPAFAVVMVMVMVGRISRLGLAEGLGRFLPDAGSTTGRLVARAVAVSAAVSGVCTLIFVLGLDIWAPGLVGVRASLLLAVFVVVAAMAWATYQLADVTLAALYPDQDWVWLARAGISLGRLGLLLALTALVDDGGEGRIILSWGLPVLVGVALTAVLVGRPLLADGADVEARSGAVSVPLRRLRTVGRSEWLLGVADWIAIGVVALVALWALDPSAASRYFVAWLLAHVGVVAVGGVVEAFAGRWVRSDQADDRSLTRALGYNALLAVVVASIVIGLVQLISPILGPEYGSAVGPARIMALVAVPSAVVTTLTLRLRAEDRVTVVIGVRLLMAIGVIALAAALAGPWGVSGLVAAWLGVQMTAALGCLAALTVWWWGPRLSGGPAKAVNALAGAVHRVRALADRGELNRQVRDHLGRLYQTMPQWKRESASTIRQTLAVTGHDGRPPLRLELSRTGAGAEQLKRRREAVSELNGLASLGSFRNLIPYPIDNGEANGATYLVESVVSGERGDADANAALMRQRVEAITDTVVELHNETAFDLAVDEDVLDQWVARPLRRLGDSVRIPDADLARAAGLIFEGLNGLTLSAACIHGSLRMDQALFEQGGPRLTGLVNWEWSQPGPVALDWGVLALSAMMQEEGRDLGPVVRDLLDEPAKLRLHPAFVSAVGDTVPPQVLVLMAWLQYTRPVVIDSGTRGLSRYWEARNVRPVLSRLLNGAAL